MQIEKMKRVLSELHKIRISESNKGYKRTIQTLIKKSKPIQQFDFKGNLIQEFYGATEASRALHIYQGNITACCKGARKTAGGYIWKYKNEDNGA